MITSEDRLSASFHEDHAVLGRGFHELSSCLAGRDLTGARAAARALDDHAGAHIAFEERAFYPELRALVGDQEVNQMYREHAMGLSVIRALRDVADQDALPEARWDDLLRRSRHMESHVAECGELFGAMGRLDPHKRRELFGKLLDWRRRAPRWTDMAELPGSLATAGQGE